MAAVDLSGRSPETLTPPTLKQDGKACLGESMLKRQHQQEGLSPDVKHFLEHAESDLEDCGGEDGMKQPSAFCQ